MIVTTALLAACLLGIALGFTLATLRARVRNVILKAVLMAAILPSAFVAVAIEDKLLFILNPTSGHRRVFIDAGFLHGVLPVLATVAAAVVATRLARLPREVSGRLSR